VCILKGLGPTFTFSSLISHSGTVVHVGQAFFNESWNDEVFNTSPYTSNTNERTLNSDDSILNSALQNGYSAYTAYVRFMVIWSEINQVSV